MACVPEGKKEMQKGKYVVSRKEKILDNLFSILKQDGYKFNKDEIEENFRYHAVFSVFKDENGNKYITTKWERYSIVDIYRDSENRYSACFLYDYDHGDVLLEDKADENNSSQTAVNNFISLLKWYGYEFNEDEIRKNFQEHALYTVFVDKEGKLHITPDWKEYALLIIYQDNKGRYRAFFLFNDHYSDILLEDNTEAVNGEGEKE